MTEITLCDYKKNYIREILKVHIQRRLFGELEGKVPSEKRIHFEVDLIGADDVILNELKTTMKKCLNVNQVILFRKGTDSIKTYLKDTATSLPLSRGYKIR